MIGKDEDLLGSLIHDVAHLLRLDIDGRLKAHNLTRVKWLALGVIQDNNDISQSDLAAILELGNATVGRLVDRLVEREFVVRGNDPADRRSYLLSLTPLALSTIQALSDVPGALEDDALIGLSQSDRAGLSRCLLKMKSNLRNRLAALTGGALVAEQAIPAMVQDVLLAAVSI